MTHALINLQRSRNVSGMFNLRRAPRSRSMRETDAGIIVRGARILATLGPLADEIAVYSPRLARHSEEHSPFAISFSIPCGTRGLKFLCRDSFDLGRSHFDQPLGSRFEEMDCIVFFDDVLVPWERVFLLYDVDRLNATPHVTHSTAHSAHQGAAKNLAKCEFVLGLALLMTQTLGNAHLPHTEERIGELMLTTELMRSCMRAAEADAEIDRWGVMCPGHPAGRKHPQPDDDRLSADDRDPPAVGVVQLSADPERSGFQRALEAGDRAVPGDRQHRAPRTGSSCSAWRGMSRATPSAAARCLYERFFASDPLTRARAMAAIYPKGEVMERVLEFLGATTSVTDECDR